MIKLVQQLNGLSPQLGKCPMPSDIVGAAQKGLPSSMALERYYALQGEKVTFLNQVCRGNVLAFEVLTRCERSSNSGKRWAK